MWFTNSKFVKIQFFKFILIADLYNVLQFKIIDTITLSEDKTRVMRERHSGDEN